MLAELEHQAEVHKPDNYRCAHCDAEYGPQSDVELLKGPFKFLSAIKLDLGAFRAGTAGFRAVKAETFAGWSTGAARSLLLFLSSSL